MNDLLIVCLCADWCTTCREYKLAFEALAGELPQHRFVWIDIEDQGDLVADIDIENFPTLLVARKSQLLFAGTMLPHIDHLSRVVQTLNRTADVQMTKLSSEHLAPFDKLILHLNRCGV